MTKELEETIKRLKAIKDAKLDSDSEIALFEFAENDKYIDLILNYIENSISKEVVEDVIKKARLKMFSTRIMNEQEMYFLDKCIHVINDIENELKEEK